MKNKSKKLPQQIYKPHIYNNETPLNNYVQKPTGKQQNYSLPNKTDSVHARFLPRVIWKRFRKIK